MSGQEHDPRPTEAPSSPWAPTDPGPWQPHPSPPLAPWGGDTGAGEQRAPAVPEAPIPDEEVSHPAGSPPPGASPAAGPEAAEARNFPQPFVPLDASDLVRRRASEPTGGLRRVLFRMTGRRLRLGPSAREQARAELLARARTPAATGRRRIAMVSLKGGVGKTTTTVMLGHTLASVRGDNVIAVDANPDAGNLASRVPRETDASARDLLRSTASLERYADVRSFTSQAPSRLEILAGERDPALSEAFSAPDYEAVLAALERFYSVVLTDCGTGILHDAMRAVLWFADQLVVVTSPSLDAAQALGQLLDWLDQHDYHQLVATAVVVVNGVRKRSGVRVEHVAAHFKARCRAVVTIPYDDALAPGGESDLEVLDSATRAAYLELAAVVGDGFGAARLHGHEPRPAHAREG